MDARSNLVLLEDDMVQALNKKGLSVAKTYDYKANGSSRLVWYVDGNPYDSLISAFFVQVPLADGLVDKLNRADRYINQ